MNWGFNASVEVDPNQPLPVPGTGTPGVIVTATPQLPEPVGTNDEITQAPGVGSVQPTMSEAVFNFSARLVRRS